MNDVLDLFFQAFPITSKSWRDKLFRFLSQNSNLLENLWEHLEPCLDKILPTRDKVFRAINEVEPNQVRVIIVGQDPYPNPQDACGLCFSTDGERIPASLRNIFKEIQRDFGGKLRSNPNLSDWAKQGVLLINSSLTVLPGKSDSHSKIGWQLITKFIIDTVWEESPRSIFLLWGSHAQQMINRESSRILKSGHPSPLAYGRTTKNNFKGCQHFKKANQLLLKSGLIPIVWNERDDLLDFLML